ncbi:hypothetical protein swp_0548 [Shewanella piezotolerans WP3]|uniref:Uncharacterized protein n=1 Tax=Shewanella piezotolerans (strain WP3 / JCM 13877) TaxID=225849 RepID=B8CI98_SHEPW|nr:hypothetical protein swp_0548 [Shewanella piezotolerans WP3]
MLATGIVMIEVVVRSLISDQFYATLTDELDAISQSWL